MIDNPNKLNSIYKVFKYAINSPANANVVIESNIYQDYDKTDSTFKEFVTSEIPTYYLSQLGIDADNLSGNITSVVLPDSSFFIANVNTHSEYFLCYTHSGQKIDTVVWVYNYGE